MAQNNKFRMKKISISMKVLIFIFVCLLSTVVCGLSTLNAAVPHLINYQGRLTDASGAPLNGSYSINFKIYDAATAGTLLWEETQSGVVIQKGVFNILLGSVTALNLAFDKPYYLGIKVGTDVEMTPRQAIASSAYAFRAKEADVATTLADQTKLLPSGVIVMWSGSISNIPSGWVLCNGANGTPDLRDRFIFGAGNLAAPGNNRTVGSRMSLTGSGSAISMKVTNTGARAEGGQGVAETSTDYMPPYYALAYIMKL